MKMMNHNIFGNKILIEKYDVGYGDKTNINVGVSSLEVQSEKTDSGFFIPVILENNSNFILSKIKKFGDDVEDERFKEDMVVLVAKSATIPIDDEEGEFYISTPGAIVVYWNSEEYDDYTLCGNWMLIDEYTEHDYNMSSGFTVINSNNKLRALTGIVKDIGDEVISKTDIKEGFEVLYEKNSTKDIHINREDYKLVNIKSVISYWEDTEE